jgi:general L-amino acid transport system substrate-binding protein
MPQFVTRVALSLASALLALSVTAASAATLDVVKQRGSLICGVSQGLPGFSDRDAAGKWSGFDVDFCRAVSAAIFNNPDKVTYVPLSASERFDALHDGKIDLLSRNSSWTFDRESSLNLLFAAITYHDGQGFMVLRKPEIASALELDKASICVQKGTTSELNLADFFRANSMSYILHVHDTIAEVLKALEGGECDVFSTDQSGLYAERENLAQPKAAVILPEIISKEPLGPAVRADDVVWFNLVKWVAFALINAEELGIQSSNVSEALASAKPDVRRFTGVEGGFGAKLGLDNAWAIQTIKSVGNYSEIFERNIGSRSKLDIPRGLNHLWSAGGILYAPPLR